MITFLLGIILFAIALEALACIITRIAWTLAALFDFIRKCGRSVFSCITGN